MKRRRAPYISCIIPAYNHARYLPDAIESALSQDFPKNDREIIVVDDGSTDNTEEVLSRYKGEIVAVKQSNAGQGLAILRAIRLARGEIIAELDSDDVWMPRKLSSIAKGFDVSKDIAVVTHGIRNADQGLRPIELIGSSPNLARDRLVDLDAQSVLRHSRRGEWNGLFICAGGSAWAVRRSALGPHLPRAKPPRLWADIFYVFLAAASGGKALRLRQTLSLWRWHPGSASYYEREDFLRRIRLEAKFSDSVRRALEAIDGSHRRLLIEDLRALLRESAALTALLERHGRIGRRDFPVKS